MAWLGPWWKIGVLAGLGLVVIAVGVVAFLILASFPQEFNVVYGNAGGRPLLLDVYRPVGPSKVRPAVLLLHGGGWVEGDKSTQRDFANVLTKAGYVAIAVGYRLARDDGSRYPAQVDDVRQAVRWVRGNARSLGIDPDRIGAFGHSAGGHLVALLGTTDVAGRPDSAEPGVSSRVRCVVDLAGPSDFTDDASPAVGPTIAELVPNLFGKTRVEAPDAYRDASPVTHVDSRSVPTLIVHGTADEIVPIEQSRRLAEALRKAGVEVKLVELDGVGHNFETVESQDQLNRETLDFFDRHLKR